MAFICRPYRSSDRSAVRSICCDTALMGDPIDAQFPNRPFFADLITLVFTLFFPQWIIMAEDETDGTVVGYVTGCPDARQYHWYFDLFVAPYLLIRLITTGALGSAACRRFLAQAIADIRRGCVNDVTWNPACPSFAHLNLLPRVRFRGVGCQLMEMLQAKLIAADSPGMFVETLVENAHAVHAFGAAGFTQLRGYLAPGIRGPHGERLHALVMGKKF